MSNIIRLPDGTTDKLISIGEAAEIIGEKYQTAYKIIVTRKEITHQDGGLRNKKVYKKSAEAYRNAHKVQGKY